jgi:hypothetical protein
VVVATQAIPINIVIARETERSFKASAIYVASKATRKFTVGITTRMQERDPSITRRMMARVNFIMWSWSYVAGVKRTMK